MSEPTTDSLERIMIRNGISQEEAMEVLVELEDGGYIQFTGEKGLSDTDMVIQSTPKWDALESGATLDTVSDAWIR